MELSNANAVTPPRFSIIITSYNQVKFIRDAVNSALSQGHGREVIVIDDASTDGSAEFLKSYGDSIKLVLLAKNIGANRARNHGASLAHGEYLVFLDGDDLFSPWALDTYEAVVAATQARVILAPLLFFDGSQPPAANELPREINYAVYENLIQKNRTHRASASATVVKRSVFGDVGGWTDELFHLDDLDIMMKLGVTGRCVQILSPATTCYRVHGGNTVRQAAPFIPAMLVLIAKEKSGAYPGGSRFRFERYAFLGGPIIFWIKKSFRAKLYSSAISLVLHGWFMACAAIVRRFYTLVAGTRAFETIKM